VGASQLVAALPRRAAPHHGAYRENPNQFKVARLSQAAVSGAGSHQSRTPFNATPTFHRHHYEYRIAQAVEESKGLWTDIFTLDLPADISRDVSEIEYLRRTSKEEAELAKKIKRAIATLQHINYHSSEENIEGS
jgi:hypothetical protein